MSEELKPVEVADEIKAVMEDENFIPSSEDVECYGKHQIKPSEILPCPFCGSEYLQFGDWGTHGAYDKVACGNGCTDWIPVERWNNRPAEEALQNRIAELEQQLSEKITGETSDGYHTFNELYHHRAVLFSAICSCFSERSWKSRKHHDGTMFPGMFIVGIETDNGQATYHYDIESCWDMFPVKELEQAPEWDGHTPQEAIERIGKMQIRPFAELEQENREQLIDYENRLCEARKYQQDSVRRCEEMEAECVRLRKALRGLMQAVDGCLTPNEALLWKKCEEALKGVGDVEKDS